MVKKRTRQQEMESQSRGRLCTLFSPWIVNKLDEDFGIDFDVRLTKDMPDGKKEVLENMFFIQLKSTEDDDPGEGIENLSISDWSLFMGQTSPVMLIKYYFKTDTFYYAIIQPYIWDILEKEDPNWKRASYKTIHLKDKITDLRVIEKLLIDCQKRIIKHLSLGLTIGEGIKITKEDLSELTKAKEKGLLDFKGLSLIEAYEENKKGNKEKSMDILLDVYRTPREDDYKIRSIIGISYTLNIAEKRELIELLRYCDEGIALAKKIDNTDLFYFIRNIKNHAEIFAIARQISMIILQIKVQEESKIDLFSHLYNIRSHTLYLRLQKLSNEFNESLVYLLEHNPILYVASLPFAIDIMAFEVMNFAIFDQGIIELEQERRESFIEQCLLVIDVVSDLDIKKDFYFKLSSYYYWNKDIDNALKYINIAIRMAKEDDDQDYISFLESFLDKFQTKPNPYDFGEPPDIETMSSEDYQQMYVDQTIAQGINLSSNDELTKSINIALHDMNPEKYLKYCENLHISYLSQSLVGQMIGIPSMGSKVFWCKYGGTTMGYSLDVLFDGFVRNFCQQCPYRKKREEDWTCSVKIVKEQMENEEFQQVIESVLYRED